MRLVPSPPVLPFLRRTRSRASVFVGVMLLALLAGACSGSRAELEKKVAPKAGGSTHAAVKAVQSNQAVTLPKTLPPASVFFGSATVRTSPSRYCVDGACTSLTPAGTSAVAGPDGAAVLFSLSAAPTAARIEIRVPGRAASTVVPLDPGTAMIWQASLPIGTYPLTLVATYAKSEVTWPFTVRLITRSRRR